MRKPLISKPFTFATRAIGAALLAFVAVAIYGAYTRHPYPEAEAAATPARFALVSYSASRFGALESDVLDSGLSVSDCRYALDSAHNGARPSYELLLTCEILPAR